MGISAGADFAGEESGLGAASGSPGICSELQLAQITMVSVARRGEKDFTV
jgi:hypothetical protein